MTISSKFKLVTTHTLIILMLCLCFGTFGAVNSVPVSAMSQVCKVTGSNVYVRKSASTKAKKLGTLKKGTYRIIKGSKKDKKGVTWYKVAVKKKTGYISSKYASKVKVSITKINQTGTVKTSSSSLFARSGPGSIYGTVGKIAKGKKITLTGKAKDVSGVYWYQTKVSGKTAYVSSKYVSTTPSKATTTATTKATTASTTKSTTASASTYTVTSLKNLTGKVSTSSSVLNVRSGPGTSYSTLGTLKNGQTFDVTGKTTVSGDTWYTLSYNKSTGFVAGNYVTTTSSTATQTTTTTAKSTTTTTASTSDRITRARNAAADWAIAIANDNSFHYGQKPWALHFGCYFCGTNQSANNAKFQDGGKSVPKLVEKSYCCNPFVTAAYAHGARAPEVDCKVSSKRFGLAGDANKVLKNNPTIFTKVRKPSKITSLVKGDILLTNSHAVIYVGDGKIAHAAGVDDGVAGSTKWNNSIRVDTFTTSSKYWTDSSLVIYRYNGTGKF